MNISELAPLPSNPRKVTDSKLKQLKKTLREFGDLSGIVFNSQTGHLVGGHQRVDVFGAEGKLVITKRHTGPTRTGTIAEGYIVQKGERYAFREVQWDDNREKAANLAANNAAGSWDVPEVSKMVRELASFDVNYDLDLTGFTPAELKQFEVVTVPQHTRTKAEKPPKCRHGQVYVLDGIRLRCHSNALEFCDKILKQWVKYSGSDAVLEAEELEIPAGQAKRSGKTKNR